MNGGFLTLLPLEAFSWGWGVLKRCVTSSPPPIATAQTKIKQHQESRGTHHVAPITWHQSRGTDLREHPGVLPFVLGEPGLLGETLVVRVLVDLKLLDVLQLLPRVNL